VFNFNPTPLIKLQDRPSQPAWQFIIKVNTKDRMMCMHPRGRSSGAYCRGLTVYRVRISFTLALILFRAF